MEKENPGYQIVSEIQRGSFGVVYFGIQKETNREVAIKKTLIDRRFKNRELELLRFLRHPNIVQFINYYYSQGQNDLYMNIVMQLIPNTLHKSIVNGNLSFTKIKNYAYQIMKALAYLHSKNICHRDIKPKNFLLTQSHELKLCDFGSAKRISQQERNVSYICSRFYRAPELIFGSTNYSTAIDIWSAGCIVAEMMTQHPIFIGESNTDQLLQIIKLRGTPNRLQIQNMNPFYRDYRFPFVKSIPLKKIFDPDTPQDLIDFVDSLLQYSPEKRPTAQQALQHPLFDQINLPEIIEQFPHGSHDPFF